MKKKIIIPLVALAVAGTVAVTRFLDRDGRSDPNAVRVSGNIEVTDARLSFKIPGLVSERLVSEGRRVEMGQEVARLDKTDLEQESALREAEVEAARAALDELTAGSRPEEIKEAEALYLQAKAALDELLAGSRPQEVAAARAAVQGAKAEADRWQGEYERQKSLHEQDVVSDQDFERTRAAHEAAQKRLQEVTERLNLVLEGPRKERIDQAREAVKQAEARHALVKKGPREEAIRKAQAQLEKARQALALARTRLGYAELSSPLSGLVLSENVEAGEYVSPGTPVVTVADMENVWMRAYINEADLGRVKVGDKVRVSTDTYPGKVYAGTVSFISSEAEFTPKNVQTQEERVKLVYRIKVEIANRNMELKPGMPADGVILLGRAGG
ncbi:HlyD family secretion protein [Desulfatibacillum alkenivorans DSM 16219]|jgi:HlyD family secretion protein|uniref:HlyD family secretion protein n=1 Tax=Desulfatibacillum alkenivorans DSM 16219 TaxID=1121393 RepID=A0A1M7A0J3_9BACT|nr:efflux RND transporter periplasmic adaptor subunit [Desulfatibacillum alkenivorans]SHL36129.1 HlyD family secretion protein [Desulfatibacillum alkenivorans DSM 16219]